MRRTYRSKKDIGGALDHKDMLRNIDEKSSAFDAFYIQNIKQTKRELSCVTSSNYVGVASNKVRKRKYVKRLVKEVESLHQNEMSTSAYLTPDKSIRVNKILDPFDMILNSSSAPAIEKTIVPKKESKTYVRKRKHTKKLNYSKWNSSESDKENTMHTTDIKSHELHLEEISTKNPVNVDESINKIVGKLSMLNNMKTNSNGSFNTSYKTRNRLNKNYQSPFLQKSPLCSTPFKEKYRGVSIYKFSPISLKEQMSPTCEDKDDSNQSIILVCKSSVIKPSNEYKISPVIQISDNSIKKKINIENNSSANMPTNVHNDNSIPNIEESSCQITESEPFLGFSSPVLSSIKNKCSSYVNRDNHVIESLDKPTLSDNNSKNQSDDVIFSNEQSPCHITHSEPFLGFSNNESKCLTKEKIKNIQACIDINSTQGGLKELNDHNDYPKNQLNVIVNNNKRITELGFQNCDTTKLKINLSYDIKTSNISTDVNEEVINKSEIHDSLKNDDEKKFEISKSDSSNSSDFKIIENELEHCKTCNDESQSTMHSSVEADKCSTSSKSTAYFEYSDNESMYDTCGSNESFISDTDKFLKEPLVIMERLNDSVFLKYYKKGIEPQNETMYVETDKDFDGISNISKQAIIDKFNNENSDADIQPNAIVITDSSTTEDVVSAEEFHNDKDKHISFVTTRRRYEITNDSMFQFDQSCGSSTDCDKTVLSKYSNKNNLHKSDNENLENVSIVGDGITVTGNCKHIKTDTVEDQFISKISRDSSSVDDLGTIHSNKYVSKTRRASKITRNSAVAAIGSSPILKSKQFATRKRTSKMSKRKTSRSTKQSSSSSEDNNSEKEFTLRYSTETNDTVVGNYNLESDFNNLETRTKLSLPVENSSSMVRGSILSYPERSSFAGIEKPTIVLQPGKKWERSLSIYRRMTMMTDYFDQSILEDDCLLNKKGRKYRQSVISTMEMQDYSHRDSLHNDSINSRRSTFVSCPGRPTIALVKDPSFSRVSLNTSSVFDDLKGFLSEECDDTVIELSKLSIADSEREVTIIDNFHESERVTTARDYVLRRCNQTEPLLFDECYPEALLKNCHKIGEGVYGEVFLWRARDGRARVMKIVPIAGSIKVNGERQKDFHEIISEIVIAMELSALRAPIADIERQLDAGSDALAVDLHAIENATDVFNEVLAARCVVGPYPSRLLELWELFDECRGSENDSPAALPADQRYLVLELANAGQDLESFQFAGAHQAHALLQQIAFGLAVAEEAFQFEHRDLHWGNVLIAPTEQKFATFVLRGRTYRVSRRGAAATVIDYSLSRLSLPLGPDCAALYNDLAHDEQLFDAVGDHQFAVYRLMRDKLGNEWKNFEPYTNVLWLHYIVDKMITALRYKRTNTKIHKHYIEKLKGIRNTILEHGSAVQYVLSDIDY